MRLAIAQIRTLPTRLDDNVAAICAAIDRADTLGAEVIVFPELAIPGYGCLDHFERVSFLERNLRARDAVVAHTATTNCAAIVGYVDRADGKSYNSAAVIHRGEQIATVDKTHLPHYDIFWESKYFEPARRRRPVEIAGRKVGIEICEDLWDESYPVKVSDALVADGAEFLINISASPFSVGKLERRRALVEGVTGRHGVPFVYVNLVGSQDGYEGETVFDGRSFAVDEKGQPLLVAPGFEEVVEMVTVPIAGPADAAASAAWPETQPIEELHDALTLGIREYLHRSGFARAIIGLSGGIDSAVVAALATEALGPESVLGVTMPSSITSDETLSDARALAANLGIRCETRSIRELVAAWETEALATHGELKSGLTRQNVQARLRGLILMEYSNEDSRALVISTGNKTELALGYCTLYGDMCGGLAAISDVSKHDVYGLAEHINARAGRELVPQTTITRAPTAELEPGQTDADNLPADYDVLSPLVEAIVEEQATRETLIERFPEAIVDRTRQLVFRSEYKRRQAAPGIRVSTKAFGSGRRYPIDGDPS